MIWKIKNLPIVPNRTRIGLTIILIVLATCCSSVISFVNSVEFTVTLTSTILTIGKFRFVPFLVEKILQVTKAAQKTKIL